MLVLGIETSCDETAAAVVRDGHEVLSNVVYSQVAQHQPYGGVVPEIASRSHVEQLPGIVEQAMGEAGADWNALDAIAVTYGPGLASSLLVGVASARALALRLEKPLLGVNHLEAHLYSLFLGDQAPKPEQVGPMVVLLVTGGHTGLVAVDAVGRYRLLGQTLDDAAGEALDKGATLMGLGYPGGPAIEKAAQGGRRDFVEFPLGLRRPDGAAMIGGLRREFCFSFSGLKTALLYYLRDHPDVLPGHLSDVAASYQESVFDALLNRVQRVFGEEQTRVFACVGGVARNRRLREKLDALAARLGVTVHAAAPQFCTDNAAMIAALASTGLPATSIDLTEGDIQPNLPVGRAA